MTNTMTKTPRQFKITVAGRVVTVWPQDNGTRVYEMRATDRRPILVERDAFGSWMLSMTGIKINATDNGDGSVLLGDCISVNKSLWSAISAM